jgi:integrase
LILTAARSGELLKARWSEIEGSTWVIPAPHTKIHKEHRVPLSQRAIDILAGLPRINDYIFAGHRIGQGLGGDAMIEVLRGLSFCASGENEAGLTVHGFRSTFRDWAAECTAFPNEVCEAALAHAVNSKVLRGLSFCASGENEAGLTVHGFRSTFRDWAAECTAFPNEVCEAALAHAVNSKVEAAYRRGDLFEKRARLMQAWSDYCEQPPVNSTEVVTPIRGVS